MTPLICKCCGGKIDTATMSCLYCDTVYVDEYEQIRCIKQENNSIRGQLDKEELYNEALNAMKNYDSTIMTPNEVRKKIGLNPIADFGITVEEATKSFMNLSRAISLTYHHN